MYGDDDLFSQEEMEFILMALAPFGSNSNTKPNPPQENPDVSSDLFDIKELEKIVSINTKVDYPEYLTKELRKNFGDNEDFIRALTAGDARAINHLGGIDKYQKKKRKLDAYVSLTSWLIENNIEYLDNPEPSMSGEEEVSDIDKKILDSDNTDTGEESDSTDDESEESKKGKNDKDDKNGKFSEKNNFNRSKNETNQIQKQKGGRVKKKQKSKGSDSGSDESQGGIMQRIKSSLLGGEKSQSPKDSAEDKSKSSGQTPSPTDIPKSVESALDEILKNDGSTEKQESSQDGGRHNIVVPGGRDISITKAEAIISSWINKTAVAGIYLKTSGYDNWDKKKIAKYAVTGQEWKIPSAKYKHLPDKIMFMLDFSGSCRWISKTFARLGKAAAAYDHVIVAYGGFEGFVQGFITKDTDITDDGALFRRPRKEKEMCLGDFLQKNKDIKQVIILGDYDGTKRYIDAYMRNRRVKFTWFLCERKRNYSSYSQGILQTGLNDRIFEFDGSVKDLARLVSKL